MCRHAQHLKRVQWLNERTRKGGAAQRVFSRCCVTHPVCCRRLSCVCQREADQSFCCRAFRISCWQSLVPASCNYHPGVEQGANCGGESQEMPVDQNMFDTCSGSRGAAGQTRAAFVHLRCTLDPLLRSRRSCAQAYGTTPGTGSFGAAVAGSSPVGRCCAAAPGRCVGS